MHMGWALHTRGDTLHETTESALVHSTVLPMPPPSFTQMTDHFAIHTPISAYGRTQHMYSKCDCHLGDFRKRPWWHSGIAFPYCWFLLLLTPSVDSCAAQRLEDVCPDVCK
jgi:hypothetical protein